MKKFKIIKLHKVYQYVPEAAFINAALPLLIFVILVIPYTWRHLAIYCNISFGSIDSHTGIVESFKNDAELHYSGRKEFISINYISFKDGEHFKAYNGSLPDSAIDALESSAGKKCSLTYVTFHDRHYYLSCTIDGTEILTFQTVAEYYEGIANLVNVFGSIATGIAAIFILIPLLRNTSKVHRKMRRKRLEKEKKQLRRNLRENGQNVTTANKRK